MNKENSLKNIASPIQWIMAVGTVLLSALYMPLFKYSANAVEANISDVFLPAAIFSGIGLVYFAVLALALRNTAEAAVSAVIMILMLENYAMLESGIQTIFPALRYWHILPILIVICLHLVYVFHRFVKDEICTVLNKVLVVVFGALVLVNIVLAVSTVIMSDHPQQSAKNENVVTDTEKQDDVKTNIYYFILDEAASFPTLQNHFGYDAADFRQALTDYNFCISDDSYNEIYSQGTPRTVEVLTNLINLDYVAEYGLSADTLSEYRNDDSLLYAILKNHGYSFRGSGNTKWLNIDSETDSNDSSKATTIEGTTLQQIIMEGTFLYPFFNMDTTGYKSEILEAFAYYQKDIFNVDSTFTLTYVNCPHQPFVFDENGNPVATAKQNDTSDYSIYLNQYKFMMKEVMGAVDRIIANDPDSIIVICSDHGPRFVPQMERSEQSNILNAVYYKGEDISEISGQSSVNTMRIILSRLFGENLPLVEVPNE